MRLFALLLSGQILKENGREKKDAATTNTTTTVAASTCHGSPPAPPRPTSSTTTSARHRPVGSNSSQFPTGGCIDPTLLSLSLVLNYAWHGATHNLQPQHQKQSLLSFLPKYKCSQSIYIQCKAIQILS